MAEQRVSCLAAADDHAVPLPGDVLVAVPLVKTTQAVTIQAAPSRGDPARSLVLFTGTHLPYLVPARLRDNSRLRISGERRGHHRPELPARDQETGRGHAAVAGGELTRHLHAGAEGP